MKQVKTPTPYHVNYLKGFWLSYARDTINRLVNFIRRQEYRSFLKGRFSFKLRWEHVVISFLLGALLIHHGSGHVVKAIQPISPAPAMISIKPLPLLKEASYPPVDTLETVWVNKLRPSGTYTNNYVPGNCTWYVASRLPIPNSMGNASNWAYAAAAAGLTVSSVPKPGSIAQTSGDGYMGHVAVVESVNPDGSFVVSEMNFEGLGIVDTRTATTAEFNNFIYV